MGAFALGDLVFVVRELQVHAAGVDVDGLAQVGGGHRRALDVPARAAAAPGGLPAGEVFAGGLPQHEVARVALVRRHVDARAGQHLVGVPARELAVAGEAADREQHVALGGIGVAGFHQLADHLQDLAHVRGRLRLDVRRGDTQRGHVLAVGGGEASGDVGDRHPGLARGGVDLVVDVGDVAGVAQRAVAAPQQVGQHPEHHRPARVADVHVVVDRRPAYVHGRAGRVDRLEGLGAAGQRVVEAQAHCVGMAVGEVGNADSIGRGTITTAAVQQPCAARA